MVHSVDYGRAVDDEPKSQSYRGKYQHISENRKNVPTGGGWLQQACVAGSRSLFHLISPSAGANVLAIYVPEQKSFDIRCGGTPATARGVRFSNSAGARLPVSRQRRAD
jgi:hypothetical protein